MTRIARALVAAVLLISCSRPARAQISMAEAQQAIREISVMIDSGRLSGADLTEALLNRAYLYANTGQPGRANEDVAAVLRTDPGNPDAYYIQGLAAFAGSPARAADSFSRVIRNENESARGYRGRAWSLLADGRHADAAKDFASALRIDPDHGEATRGLAWAQLQGKRYREAARTFTTLLDRRPLDADAMAARGIAYYLDGQAAEARADFRSAMRLMPNQPDQTSRYDNTVRLQDWKRYRRLGEVVEAAVRRRTNDPDAWIALGILYYHGGTPELSPFDRARAADPANVDALMFTGFYHCHVAFNRDRAIEAFSKVLELEPAHAEALYRRALVTAVDREAIPLAIADIERALSLTGGDAALTRVRDQLRAAHAEWERSKTEAAIARAHREARAHTYALTFWGGLGFLLANNDGRGAPGRPYVGSPEFWIDVLGR